MQSKSHSWPAICSWTQICSWSVTFWASGCAGLSPSTLHQYGGPTAGLSLRISNYRKYLILPRCWEFWCMPTFNYSCGSSKQHFNCQHFRQIQAPWMRSTRTWGIYEIVRIFNKVPFGPRHTFITHQPPALPFFSADRPLRYPRGWTQSLRSRFKPPPFGWTKRSRVAQIGRVQTEKRKDICATWIAANLSHTQKPRKAPGKAVAELVATYPA